MEVEKAAVGDGEQGLLDVANTCEWARFVAERSYTSTPITKSLALAVFVSLSRARSSYTDTRLGSEQSERAFRFRRRTFGCYVFA